MADTTDVAFLIADLAGYTALTAAHGGEEAAGVVTRYRRLAEDALEPGTRVTEQVGDQVLVVAPDVGALVHTALRLRAAVDAEPRFPGVRAGIHGGPVVERDGRFFGAALNLTARLAAHAASDQILGTSLVAAVCRDRPDVVCRSLGAVRFKNVPEAVEIFDITTASAAPAVETDPVCLMHLRPAEAPARLPYAGRTLFFCSFECARQFATDPETFLQR